MELYLGSAVSDGTNRLGHVAGLVLQPTNNTLVGLVIAVGSDPSGRRDTECVDSRCIREVHPDSVVVTGSIAGGAAGEVIQERLVVDDRTPVLDAGDRIGQLWAVRFSATSLVVTEVGFRTAIRLRGQAWAPLGAGTGPVAGDRSGDARVTVNVTAEEARNPVRYPTRPRVYALWE